MVTCAVIGCKSYKKNNPHNYTFHKFPQDHIFRQKWIKMLNRKDWVPKKCSSVCSKHFEPDCFSFNNVFRVKLRYGSIPTLLLPGLPKPELQVSSLSAVVPSTSSAMVVSVQDNTPTKKTVNFENETSKPKKKTAPRKKKVKVAAQRRITRSSSSSSDYNEEYINELFKW